MNKIYEWVLLIQQNVNDIKLSILNDESKIVKLSDIQYLAQNIFRFSVNKPQPESSILTEHIGILHTVYIFNFHM